MRTGLSRLTDRLGLNFGAADFKACPHTGHPLFLEFNNAPMFAAFDKACGGGMVDAILESLLVGEDRGTNSALSHSDDPHAAERTASEAHGCSCH